jgi:hypothetical protein
MAYRLSSAATHGDCQASGQKSKRRPDFPVRRSLLRQLLGF